MITTKRNILKFILSVYVISHFANTAFAVQETLESLKAKENEILTLLKNSKKIEQNNSVKIQKENISNNITIKNVNYSKDNFLKRINKRKELRNRISLKRNLYKETTSLSVPVIVAGNKIIEINKNKINNDLNNYIKQANNVLKDIKEKDSKKTVDKKYYTISNDYFDDEDDSASFVYAASDISLHTLPSLSSKLIYLVKANTRLKLDKNHGAWYRVKGADNKYGWILGDMINFSNPSSLSTLRNKGKSF